jgi:hypothetical protein
MNIEVILVIMYERKRFEQKAKIPTFGQAFCESKKVGG